MERSNKLLLGAIYGVACGWLTYKYFIAPNSRQKRNKTRRRVGVISQIYIHPLKSGRGILVDSAFAGEKGLSWNGLDDRGWCVRESKNNVKVSARREPKLFKINVKKISDEKVEFYAEGFPSLIVDLNPADCSPTTTHIFGNEVESIDIGDEAARWISEFLGKECRISFKPRNRHLRDKSIDRPSGRDWRLENNPINDKNEAGFQDGYPYLMLGEDSLADINENIRHKTYTMRTFRPNFVIKSDDGRPWAEDSWVGMLQIGDAILSNASPCPRCVMTTVDPETMEKDKEGEPLKSLKKFRQVQGRDKDHIDIYGDTPCVGMNTAVLKPGKISVGDEIILIE